MLRTTSFINRTSKSYCKVFSIKGNHGNNTHILFKCKINKVILKEENYILDLKSKFKRIHSLCNSHDTFEIVEESMNCNEANRIHSIPKEENISR